MPSTPEIEPPADFPLRSSRVQSVDRAVRLLRALADGPHEASSLAEVAAATGLNRATAWRILMTLAEHRLVAYDRVHSRWSIGPGVGALIRPVDLDRLLSAARPALARLAIKTGETAALAVLRGQSLVYVDEVAPSAIVAATWLGREVPLHATSTGKVLLAFGTGYPEAGPLTDGLLPRYNERTVTSPVDLEAELAQVRALGYSVCRGEFDASAYGVSAPILGPSGDLRAVLSVWGPTGRVTEEHFAGLGADVVEAARALSRP